jgi:hypothetical protein
MLSVRGPGNVSSTDRTADFRFTFCKPDTSLHLLRSVPVLQKTDLQVSGGEDDEDRSPVRHFAGYIRSFHLPLPSSARQYLSVCQPWSDPGTEVPLPTGPGFRPCPAASPLLVCTATLPGDREHSAASPEGGFHHKAVCETGQPHRYAGLGIGQRQVLKLCNPD